MEFGGNTITQIKQVSGRLFERMLAENDIHAFNSAQAHILRVLWIRDGISVHEVAQQTGLAMASLSGMLDRMEKGNLIDRRRDTVDRRKVLIYLTDTAKAMRDDCVRVQQDLQAIYYAGFSAQEIEQFEQFLQRVLNNVGNALHGS